MRLGRVIVAGADGPEPRVVVGAGDDHGPWYDLRGALRGQARRGGASDAGARRLAEALAPASMSAALALGPRFLDAAREVLREAPEDRILSAPCFTNALDPSNYRDFMVFERHFSFGYRWQGKPVPDVMYELPVSYAGNPLSFIGTGETIPWPGYTERLDYELELGIVIGSECTNVSPDEALGHVAGLTILNDVSARDIQAREMAGGLGPSKGKHFCCVTGPWITTLDEIPAEGLRMTAQVNGETLCDTTSAEMVWSVAEIVSWASQGEVLAPGTLLGSGTCNGGSTIERGVALAPGDRLELSIERLGTLRNELGVPAADTPLPRARRRTPTGESAELHFLI